jgi:hypothetical protein
VVRVIDLGQAAAERSNSKAVADQGKSKKSKVMVSGRPDLIFLTDIDR